MAWHPDRADIGIRHAKIFCLSAGIATEQVRVAEQSSGGIAPQLRGAVVVRIGALTAGIVSVAAKEAFSAGNRERDHDTVTNLQIFDVTPNFNHLAHVLVAKHITTFHAWNNAAINVKVRAADRAGTDLDN